MDFKKFPIILAILLLAVLIVQPALSAENVTKIVTNNTAELENDVATKYFNYGERSLVLGDFKNAITYFDQALAENTTMLKKTDALLYIYRDKAYAQIQLEKPDDAMATLDKGLSLYPDDAMLWNNKGYLLSTLGKSQDALTAYDKAVYFDVNYTNAYINRGDVLSKMGRYSEAVASYTQAEKTDPGNQAAAEGLTVAKNGEAQSTRTMTIILAIVLVAAIGAVIWYVKFRKPAEPAPEEKKKTKSKKK
jgi:tetratricopeptide (TPR) repeat protein